MEGEASMSTSENGRWFSDEELAEMSRPTMDRAIEAIDRGDGEAAKRLCEEMKYEGQFMHDMLVDGIAGLISYVKEKLGDEGVEEAWEYSLERGWKPTVEAIDRADRKFIAQALAATWRAHSTSGVGPKPGAFEVAEDDEKLTFTMNPCGSGQRLVRLGRYGDGGYGTTDGAHSWSYGREGFPLYCTHCAFMNETLPIRWIGYPVYPSHPPQDFESDPCVWHWYKDPADIPDEHFTRHGLERPAAGPASAGGDGDG
jgi:hypothetical protein